MSLKHALAKLLILAAPILLGHLGIHLIGVGDMYVASKVSTQTVAVIGVANNLINPLLLLGLGLTMGISPLLASKRGAAELLEKRYKAGEKSPVLTILIYSTLAGVLVMGLTWIGNLYIHLTGIAPELVPSIKAYNQIVATSFPFALIFNGLKEYLQSFEKVFLSNFLAILAVFVNLGLNWVLVFGHPGEFGFNGLGEIGLAYASLSIRVILAFSLMGFVFFKFSPGRPSLQLGLEIFRFSFPISIMLCLEVSAFCLAGILAGKIGVVAAATNSIILALASVLFIFPMSVAHAVSVKVANAFGRQNIPELKSFIYAALVLTALFVTPFASAFVLFPKPILGILTHDLDVLKLGAKVCLIIASFQVVDYLQVVAAGILRGLKFTKLPSLVVFISFWVIGVPLGHQLAFEPKWGELGLPGLWIGLGLGLGLTAIFLSGFIILQFRSFGRLSYSSRLLNY